MTSEKSFLKNHIQNEVEKLVLDPSLEIKIQHISGSTDLYSLFLFNFQVEGYCRPLALMSNKAF